MGEQDREAERRELAQATDDGEVLGVALAEGDARVDGDVVVLQADCAEGGDAIEHPGEGLDDDVSVAGWFVRAALGDGVTVVEDVAGARARGLLGGARALREAADVVHDVRAPIEYRAGDGGLVGVDGDEVAIAEEGFDDGADQRCLLAHVERGAVGAGGLGADVDDVRARLAQRACAAQCGRVVAADAVAGERVVGEVQDAHDVRAVEGEATVAELPGRHRAEVPQGVLRETGGVALHQFLRQGHEVIFCELDAGDTAPDVNTEAEGGGSEGERLQVDGGEDGGGTFRVGGALGRGG